MVLESTVVCVDNSEYMRNGDYNPTRFNAEIDAINLVFSSKTRANPENNVGLVTFNNGRVLVTPTRELPKLQASLHKIAIQGLINFETGIKVAHHSNIGKAETTRCVLLHLLGGLWEVCLLINVQILQRFCYSPVLEDDKELTKIGKRLRKEKVCVDIVCFGQEGDNVQKLDHLVNTLNGKDGAGSHLLIIPPGAQIVDALRESSVLRDEDNPDGSVHPEHAHDFDPELDPELAMALRVSMEEQRAREENQRANLGVRGTTGSGSEGTSAAQRTFDAVNQENHPGGKSEANKELHEMTEKEQLAYAMQASLQQNHKKGKDEAMDTDEQD